MCYNVALHNIKLKRKMEQIVLKQKIVEKITSDGNLFGQVANSLGIAPVSLPRLLYKRDTKLTQASVLKIIRGHLGIEDDSELLEKIESDSKYNTLVESVK